MNPSKKVNATQFADTSNFVKKADYDRKFYEIEKKKYLTMENILLHKNLPNGHIFVNSLWIQNRNSTSKDCLYFINYERQRRFDFQNR